MASQALTPYLAALLYAQQGIVTAMIAARFDPKQFEENLVAVKATMRLAAIDGSGSNSDDRQAAGSNYDEIFDLYLEIFRKGDINASTPSPSKGGH